MYFFTRTDKVELLVSVGSGLYLSQLDNTWVDKTDHLCVLIHALGNNVSTWHHLF